MSKKSVGCKIFYHKSSFEDIKKNKIFIMGSSYNTIMRIKKENGLRINVDLL